MGDLGEGCDKGEDPLSALATLFGSEGSPQVTPDLAQKVINAWEAADSDFLSDGKFCDLLSYTAVVLVDKLFTIIPRNGERIDRAKDLRENLLQKVKQAELRLGDEHQNKKRILVGLQTLVLDPWHNDKLLNLKRLPTQEVQLGNTVVEDFYEMEGKTFIWRRLRCMFKMLRKGNADHISYTMKLLKVLLLKALESLRKRGDIVESALEEEADSAEDIQDPYEIGSFEAFRFLEVYILMHMFKQGDWYDISPVQEYVRLLPSNTAKVLRRLEEKLNNKDGENIEPKVWELTVEQPTKSVNTVIHEALNSFFPTFGETEKGILIRPAWNFLSNYIAHEEESCEIVKRLLKSSMCSGAEKEVKSSRQAYAVALLVLEELPSTEPCFSLFADFYSYGLVEDQKIIDKLKTSVPWDPQLIQEEIAKLSDRVLELSNIFAEKKVYPCFTFELKITAFSLNPTAGLFQNMFETQLDWPNRPACLSELSFLSQSTRKTLWAFAQSQRHASLNQPDFSQLKERCEFMLQEDNINLVKEKVLEYAHLEKVPGRSDSGRPRRLYEKEMGNNPNIKRLKRDKYGNVVKRKGLVTGKANSAKLLSKSKKQHPSTASKTAKTTPIPSFLLPPEVQRKFGPELEKFRKLKQFWNHLRSFGDANTTSWKTKARGEEVCAMYKRKFLSSPVPDVPPAWIPLYPKPIVLKKGTALPTGSVGHKTPHLRHRSVPERYRIGKEDLRKSLQIPPSCSAKPTPTNLCLTDIIPETRDEDWEKCGSVSLGMKVSPDMITKILCSRTQVEMKKEDRVLLRELAMLTAEYLDKRDKAALEHQQSTVNEKIAQVKSKMAALEVHPSRKMMAVLLKSRCESVLLTNNLNKDGGTAAGEPTHEEGLERLELGVGAIMEVAYFSKKIKPPRGPKRTKQRIVKQVMVEQALARIKKNLELESYYCKSVIQKALQEKVELEEVIPEPKRASTRQKIIPVTPDILLRQERDKQLRTKGPPMTKEDAVAGTYILEESLNEEKVFVNHIASRKSKQKSEVDSDWVPMPPPRQKEKRRPGRPPKCEHLNNKKEPQSVLKDVSNSKRKRPTAEDKWLEFHEKIKTFLSELVCDGLSTSVCGSCSEPESGTDEQQEKRSYTYYDEKVIHLAIIAMLNGKTMKEAAEENGVNRSALCKRLHVMGLRKNGDLVIPPELQAILDQYGTKIRNYAPKGKRRQTEERKSNQNRKRRSGSGSKSQHNNYQSEQNTGSEGERQVPKKKIAISFPTFHNPIMKPVFTGWKYKEGDLLDSMSGEFFTPAPDDVIYTEESPQLSPFKNWDDEEEIKEKDIGPTEEDLEWTQILRLPLPSDEASDTSTKLKDFSSNGGKSNTLRPIAVLHPRRPPSPKEQIARVVPVKPPTQPPTKQQPIRRTRAATAILRALSIAIPDAEKKEADKLLSFDEKVEQVEKQPEILEENNNKSKGLVKKGKKRKRTAQSRKGKSKKTIKKGRKSNPSLTDAVEDFTESESSESETMSSLDDDNDYQPPSSSEDSDSGEVRPVSRIHHVQPHDPELVVLSNAVVETEAQSEEDEQTEDPLAILGPNDDPLAIHERSDDPFAVHEPAAEYDNDTSQNELGNSTYVDREDNDDDDESVICLDLLEEEESSDCNPTEVSSQMCATSQPVTVVAEKDIEEELSEFIDNEEDSSGESGQLTSAAISQTEISLPVPVEHQELTTGESPAVEACEIVSNVKSPTDLETEALEVIELEVVENDLEPISYETLPNLDEEMYSDNNEDDGAGYTSSQNDSDPNQAEPELTRSESVSPSPARTITESQNEEDEPIEEFSRFKNVRVDEKDILDFPEQEATLTMNHSQETNSSTQTPQANSDWDDSPMEASTPPPPLAAVPEKEEGENGSHDVRELPPVLTPVSPVSNNRRGRRTLRFMKDGESSPQPPKLFRME